MTNAYILYALVKQIIDWCSHSFVYFQVLCIKVLSKIILTILKQGDTRR